MRVPEKARFQLILVRKLRSAQVPLVPCWWLGITVLFDTRKLHPIVVASLVLLAFALASTACGESSTGAPPQAAGTSSSTVVGPHVGNCAPDFTLTLSNGQTARLTSLREQGKPVVLYFFTTW
ncbi:MAG: redoxin domain-containing protein [Dehalococcoidia bacterium]|nr:redoxin domain-containing protein [Dehalococcoidia bacterium]